MTIYDYIDTYGIYTFDEKEFNEVDSVIFSFLSYVNFDCIVENKKVLLRDVGRMHLGLHKKGEKNVIAVKEANKLLNYMKDTNRFRDCLLSHYVYEADSETQFGVISIEYQKGSVYVSYEGTDQMISGWKDNLLLSYSFPTASHKKAIEYLNKYYTFSFKKIIVGGHSRGGNFAMVAAMGCNLLVKSKIKAVYNMDGPGLLDGEFRSKAFKKILPKYHHIIPSECIVGIILYNANDQVVHSTITGPLAHSIAYWEVEGDHFKKGKLSSFSKSLHKGLLSYIDSYSREELKMIIRNLDKVCQRAKVTSLLEFKEDPRKIIDFIRSSTSLDMESRNMIYDLLNVVIRAIGDSKYRDFMEFVKKFKLDI